MPARAKNSLPLPGLRWRGFTVQMFLVVILPLSLLMLVAVIASQSLHHQAMRSLVGDRDLRAVRTAATSISEEITHRASLITLIGHQAGNYGSLRELADNLPAMQEEFPGGMAWVTPNGSVEITPGSPLASLSGAELQAQLPARGETFSVPFEISALPGQTWVLAGVELRGGWLVGAFSPATLAQQALSGAITPDQTRVTLAAPGEVRLYEYGPAASLEHGANDPGVASALRGESGIDYIHLSSGEHVVAFSPVPPLGWGLVLEESWESIASPALNTTQAAPLLLVPMLLLALLALWFGARQIIQPLQALQTGSAELARGHFEAIEEPVGGISEIRQLQSDLIEMARALQSAQDSLRGYIGAITAGVENERRSLARELHDDTIQTLIALQQRIQLANLSASGNDSLLEVQQSVQQTINNLRRMIRGLRPIYLEDLGLVSALEMLARETGQANALVVEFACRGEERRLPPESELALYRITQEALSNACRHALASHARVEIVFEPQMLRLLVKDDGRGFSLPGGLNEFARQGHFGLLGLQERAELIGATLKIVTAPGEGTAIHLNLPAARP